MVQLKFGIQEQTAQLLYWNQQTQKKFSQNVGQWHLGTHTTQKKDALQLAMIMETLNYMI